MTFEKDGIWGILIRIVLKICANIKHLSSCSVKVTVKIANALMQNIKRG